MEDLPADDALLACLAAAERTHSTVVMGGGGGTAAATTEAQPAAPIVTPTAVDSQAGWLEDSLDLAAYEKQEAHAITQQQALIFGRCPRCGSNLELTETSDQLVCSRSSVCAYRRGDTTEQSLTKTDKAKLLAPCPPELGSGNQ